MGKNMLIFFNLIFKKFPLYSWDKDLIFWEVTCKYIQLFERNINTFGSLNKLKSFLFKHQVI